MDHKKVPFDSKMMTNIVTMAIGIAIFMFLFNLDMVLSKVSLFISVSMPFIIGFALAYLLNAPVRFFEETVYSNLKRKKSWSILTVYLFALTGFIILIQLVLPQVLESLLMLRDNIQYYLDNLTALVNRVSEILNIEGEGLETLIGTYNDLIRTVTTELSNLIPKVFDLGMSLGTSLVSGAITFITALIASIYMLSAKTSLIMQIKKGLYAFFKKDSVDTFLFNCHRANRIFEGFIIGKLLDSLIIGVLCFILTLIFRIPFALLVSVIIGVTNIIPFFGPFIGAVPCLMILLIVDPWSALWFALLILGLQQFDGNILGPKILGDSTGLSPIWVLISIVVGGGLFGFIGMLLGVPTFAVIYMLTRDYVDARLEKRGLDARGNRLEAREK